MIVHHETRGEFPQLRVRQPLSPSPTIFAFSRLKWRAPQGNPNGPGPADLRTWSGGASFPHYGARELYFSTLITGTLDTTLPLLVLIPLILSLLILVLLNNQQQLIYFHMDLS